MYIPRDIWLYLGQFIPDNDLRKLFTLNSAFLELGLNARYRDISLRVLEKRTITYLVRLMDPAIAKRVRFFSIQPYVTEGFDQEKTNNTAADSHGIPRLWKKSVGVLRKWFHISKSVKPYPSTLGGLEQALVDAMSSWSNLREFSVKWWDPTQLQPIESFLLPSWSTFGPSLQKVTLVGSPTSIQAVLSSAERLPSLRELCFELTQTHADDVLRLEDVIAPFINSVNATLEALSILSWEAPLDLSQFFLKLGFFPRLRHFKIGAPFSKAFLNTPDGLTRLLRDHSRTLTSVNLDLKPSTYIDPSPEVALRGWMESINSEPHILANLTTLKIYPGNHDPYKTATAHVRIRYPVLEPTTFAIFLDLLGRSAHTLTELTIQGRFLSCDDVKSVLATVASQPPPLCLTMLHLDVDRLDLRILYLLARELPCLRKLSLCAFEDFWIDRVAGSDQANLGHLQKALRDGVYANWKLQEIELWARGRKIDWDIMQLLLRSIPSLCGFRGPEDLKTDRKWAIY